MKYCVTRPWVACNVALFFSFLFKFYIENGILFPVLRISLARAELTTSVAILNATSLYLEVFESITCAMVCPEQAVWRRGRRSKWGRRRVAGRETRK